jgi:AraC-like DNA-binding protein/mannose-6-phosphate isomerase-like protein (cupin superfamily)
MKSISDKKPIDYEENRSNKANYIYLQNDINLNFRPHMHASFEVLTVLEGELDADLGQKLFKITPGRTLIIFPNQIHSYRTPKHSKSSLLIFSPDLVPHYYQAISGKEYEEPIVSLDCVALLSEVEQAKNLYLAKGLLYQLLGEIDSKARLVDSSIPKGSVLSDLITYVKAHHSEEISLKGFAKDNGYSYNYVSNLFHQNFRLNFSRYVNMFRVEDAAYLLENSDKEITDIALEAGFSNVRSFNRAFLALKALSPSAYRQARRANGQS